MLKDERKLKEWMKMVQGLIKDEAADQEPTDAE